MAKQQSILIWERSLYYKLEGKGWVHSSLARLEDAAAVVQEHYKKGSKLLMLYDSDVLQTEFTECPGGGRPIMREAMIGSHETIANMHTAWGYQTPWNMAGTNGTYGTFCSYETVPSLYPLVSSLRDVGYTISRAVPFTTLGFQVGGAPGRTSIFLVIDKDKQAYVFLNTASGVRAARKLFAGKRQDAYDVWSEISMVFGEYGVTFDDGGQRPQVRIYQAPGTDIKTQCPYWDVLSQQAQVEVLTFDSLDVLLNAVTARHTSSLMDDMPKFIDFDFGLKIAAAVLGVILAGVGIYAYMDLEKDNKEISNLTRQQNTLTVQKTQLEKNKREIESLHALYSQDIFDYSKGRLQLLKILSNAVPKEATLTSLTTGLEMDASFRMNGVFWDSVGRSKANTTAGPKTGATNTTPVTNITRTLEGGIPGLLVTPSGNQYNEQTGDFVIDGMTPRPEGASGPASAKPAQGQVKRQ